jgi:hypothetical protein
LSSSDLAGATLLAGGALISCSSVDSVGGCAADTGGRPTTISGTDSHANVCMGYSQELTVDNSQGALQEITGSGDQKFWFVKFS